MNLAEKILHGDESSAAHLISMIEDGREEGYEVIASLYPHTGRAHAIGITGPPGVGKSTLINKLSVLFARRSRKAGIIAVDPTSARGEGALLGDRVRMAEAENEKGIFIRSMAHRGYPGGIARATLGALYVLDAMGKDPLIIESVGVGQTEIQISLLCDTIISVLTPDYGDEIQLMKAGLIEIGDIIVINKADKGPEIQHEIAGSIGIRQQEGWTIPVLQTVAVKGEGVEQVVEAIAAHAGYLAEGSRGSEQRAQKLQAVTLMMLKEELWKRFIRRQEGTEEFGHIMRSLRGREIDPYSAVGRFLKAAEGI